MQNFSNSPAPTSLPPGFSGRGGGGPPYPPQPADAQISPRMTDDYAGMQQQSLHRGHHHPSQACHMLAYSARNRGAVEAPPTQGNIHSGNSNNPYRKDAMDYYFSVGGKDRHRRGGIAYGAGFGYPNIDGHIPHQYRHAGSVSAPTSGLMSPYPVDYGSSAGSGAGAGAFSPSHQYNMSQNPAMQSVPGSQMQHRQHGQTFPTVHHGQQHRSYPHSGHRMTPQYSHYSPQGGASTGSSGMYSPPPQRYLDGAAGTGFDPKVNSVNSSSNSVSSSVAANNVGPIENVQQSYHASNYPGYSPQTHSLHKQATLQHRNSQHNLGVGYDNSLKMQHQGPSVYTKHHQASNPSIPQAAASQEIAKSPMHPNAQQTQINQNFSPISNPSPVASAVHSPSCSSSPSPLMGVSEAHGNPSGHGPSHPPTSNPRSSHGHGRLLQTMPQLSPTPNSNSSISSCGSSGSHKAHSMTAVGGSSLPPTGRNKMSLGAGIVSRDEGSSVYSSSPLDKMQDAGLNSLNALSSQVANLPNTVQHMLLTDTVLSQKKKDGGQMQQTTHGMPPSQPRSRNASAASSTSTVKDGSAAGIGDGASLDAGADEDSSLISVGGSSGTKVERDEQFSEGEHGRVRQMSGASSGSEPTSYHHPPQSQNQLQAGQESNVKAVSSDSKEPSVSDTKANEAHIPLSSLCPSTGCQSSETGPASHSTPSASSPPSSTPSSISTPQPNCVSEPSVTYNDHRSGHRKTTEIKNEVIKNESEGAVENTEKGGSQVQRDGEVNTENGQDKENRLHAASRLHKNETEEKHTSEEQQSASSVGVIVSARSDGRHTEKSKHPQDNSVEEKQSQPYLRESSSHNGDEGIDLTLYSSHHQKSNFGRPQNPPQSGPHKYGYPESTYGSDLSLKNRGRAAPTGVMESNSRYLGYQQSQSGYGPVHPKDAGSVAEALVKRGQGAVAKGHEENSQVQQFPSLLQEVLQGYNVDRRYGRPEQAFPAHLQVQQQFPSRHQYGMSENMRIQSGVAEVSGHSAQTGSSGKPPHPNQRHGNEPDFSTDPQSSVKSEVSITKISQNAEKSDVGVSQSHVPQSTDTQQPPPKHINLADYSLPQRKTLSSVSTPSSAVQELLLQEPEPLTGSIGQTESQKSSGSILAPSERRSVICDVSPNRRSTPERDRESDREREREKSQSGASVIQQPFSSPAAANDLSKKDTGEKQVMKMEMASKETGPDSANLQTDHHGSGGANEADMEYHSKSVHSSVVMNADPYRRGNVDISPLPSHPISTNPLSSPSRHQSYLHGVDLTTSSGSTFPGYRYGDSREGNIVPRSNPHFPSHHPYHNLSPQTQSTNKLQMYSHPRGPPHHPHDIGEWVKAMNRQPKEMMMQPGSSPGRHKVNQSEPRQRIISQTDMPGDQHPTKTSLNIQGSYFDMKMWEATHPGREGARMIEGDSYYRAQPPPPPPPPAPAASHGPALPPMMHGQNAADSEVSRGAPEEVKHPCPPPPPSSSKPPADMNFTQPQVQRQNKTGASGDTNPLILRRRVRSFISPIPAKRQLQDASQQRAATNSHHSPAAHSESSHHNEDDSSSSDIPCPRLCSPLPGENTYSQPISPSSANAKVLPSRKGRGLKLEAIVQKITPNIKKPAGHADDESNHYPGFSHSEIPPFNDSQDQDLAHFPRVAGGDDSYMDESHSLNDMIPFRGVDETGPLPPSAYPCDPHHASQAIKQQDFDFGLGAAVASASGDKEDFALLGPLPPPPPLPRPVQGSPPPSSSALSDIQHFTNTYQQLETRRGEQSAANLLRQKLQESGMGFDDYPGSDYYGTTPPHHSQTPGHMLNRQHQISSGRSSLSPQDSKPLESVVPKGYFPSGKKKGRPVGSVNKQKRVQNQAQTQTQAQSQTQTQNTTLSAPPAPPTPTIAAATTPPMVQATSSTPAPAAPPLSDSIITPPLAPPILTQVVKVDVESEDTQPEIEVKPVRRRRRGVKDEDGTSYGSGRQRRRRRGAAAAAAATSSVAKDDPDTPLAAGGNLGTNRVFVDPNRKGPFVPHIHVEKKIPEIGAVCTIVNAEEDKMKGERSAVGGKAGGSGIDSLLTSALSSQLSRRDRETEKRETDEVETTLQSGKALPSSGYVVSGPVITETKHSGRLLCCLCQKWANYKHLGDLYGPYYPADYAAKLPKNQPQVRQCQATTGTNKTGPNSDTSSNSIQDSQIQDAQFTKPSTESDYAISLESNPTSCTTTVRTASPNDREDMTLHAVGKHSNTSFSTTTTTSKTTSLTWDLNIDMRPIPELKREPDLEIDQQQEQKQLQQPTDEAQQRPQHRKLTSHPRFKRRHKSSEDSPRMVPSNSKASLPFQPPPPALDSLGPLAQLAQLPQMPMDSEELWVHEGCIVWTSGVYLVNGRLYGLQEALDGARETCCSYCEMVGSTMGCYSKGCTLRYHYLCAIEADCSLNEDNLSLRCPKHKFTQSIRPAKSMYLEQSERG
ncbi:transcription factor 20 isoform X2 [Anabas testudineus]|uniref:transcription factor 20 isoform X2 n=1 Tax=Anabas testudineus TaxID=64144 RepID=UPI000E45957C|nr:transcription factor 20 isoform X2 [Anabas testudineus]